MNWNDFEKMKRKEQRKKDIKITILLLTIASLMAYLLDTFIKII